MRLKPDFVQAYNNLGNVLRDKGRFDEAIASYRQAMRLKPDFAEAYSNLANVPGRSGQVRRGRRQLPAGRASEA